MSVAVEVWERDVVTPGPPTKVADITQLWGREFRLAKNDYGSCRVNIQLTDPELAEVLPGRILKFVRNGKSYGYLLGPRRITMADKAGAQERALVVAAPGVWQVLNDAPLQPPLGPGWQPWDRQRRWDYTNPALGTTSWVPATQLWQQGVTGDPSTTNSDYIEMLFDQGRFPFNPPDGFIDGSAWWIWSSGYVGAAGTNGSGTLRMPLGISYFNKTFTVASDMRARVIAAADDFLEVAIDGVVLFATAPAPEEAHSRARTHDLLLSAGTHTIRVKCENYPRLTPIGNIAGLVLAVHEVNVATNAAEAVLVHTDNTWSALDYPVAAPGFTIGQILLELLAEVQAAGWLLDVVPTFTATLDSNDNPWSLVSDVVTTLGQGLGETLRLLARTWCDTRVNHDLTWDAWVKGTAGTATAVTYAVGLNIGDLEFGGDITPVTSLLLQHQDGVLVLGDATGRQEFVDLSELPAQQAEQQGLAILDDLSAEKWAATITVEPAGIIVNDLTWLGDPITWFGAPVTYGTIEIQDVPLDHVDVFDTATVPDPYGATAVAECIGIARSEDVNGADVLIPQFGDVIIPAHRRAEQLLRRATLGSLAGRVALPAPGGRAGSGNGAAPSGPGGGSFQPLAATTEIVFERDPAVEETTSWAKTVSASGSVYEVAVELDEAEASDVDVLVNLAGAMFATVTVPAGQTYVTLGGLSTPVTKDSSQLTVACTDLGFYLQVAVRIS